MSEGSWLSGLHPWREGNSSMRRISLLLSLLVFLVLRLPHLWNDHAPCLISEYYTFEGRMRKALTSCVQFSSLVGQLPPFRALVHGRPTSSCADKRTQLDTAVQEAFHLQMWAPSFVHLKCRSMEGSAADLQYKEREGKISGNICGLKGRRSVHSSGGFGDFFVTWKRERKKGENNVSSFIGDIWDLLFFLIWEDT